MEKLKSFRITALHMEGFKSYSQPTDLTFGDPTVITGGNGRGKSSIADAIAFAVTGLPFFGERRIDRLHSEDNPDLFIRMRFVDENGTLHELSRARKSNRMTITYDGCEARQVDLTDLFGERDVFLSIFNPLYFIEELGNEGKNLLQRYMELSRGGNVYPMPQQFNSQNTEPQPKPLAQRHEVYTDMLSLLTLSAEHRENLRERGLSDDRIDQNQYRSMPQTPEGRKLLASLLRGTGHDLQGIPGFRTSYGEWTLSGPNGFLIPVRDKDGLIQGMKIRLDEGEPGRKYRWLSSRNAPNGTRSYSWTHVTGSTASKCAYITEGPLKGDVASYLDNDALFVCIGGVFAIHGLKDTLISLGVTEVVEAMDMDQMTNPQVRRAIQAIHQEVQSIRGIRYSKYVWNPTYKGIDDYYLSRAAAQ